MMKDLLHKNIQGKKVLILFLLTNLIYIVMLTVTIPKLMLLADGMKTLDMLPGGYDFDYAFKLLQKLGEEGRQVYLFRQIPLDMIYPGLFGISYCLILAYFFAKLKILKKPYVYLCWLPLIAGISDYAENLGIIHLLLRFPDITVNSVALCSFFSVFKSTATTIYFVILIITLLILGVRIMRHKLNKN